MKEAYDGILPNDQKADNKKKQLYTVNTVNPAKTEPGKGVSVIIKYNDAVFEKMKKRMEFFTKTNTNQQN